MSHTNLECLLENSQKAFPVNKIRLVTNVLNLNSEQSNMASGGNFVFKTRKNLEP